MTRNAAQAKEVSVVFPAFSTVDFNGVTDVLTVKVSARVGTNGAGALCGGHSSAVGVRVYFDADSRAARFNVVFEPAGP